MTLTIVPVFRHLSWLAPTFGLAAFLILGSLAYGEDYPLPVTTSPSYHRVHAVAGNDVLNIRQEPSAQSEIVGHFGPHASPVEIIDTKNGWGRVIAGEGNGWVRLKYLRIVNLPRLGQSRIPLIMSCSGTEPFWGLEFSAKGTAAFSSQGSGETATFTVSHAIPLSGRSTMDAVWMRNPNAVATAFVSREFCSDGMSDRLYGHRVIFSISASDRAQGYEGCCLVKSPAR